MLIALLLILFIAIQTETVQNMIVPYFTKKISAELGTPVTIKHVGITFFNKLNLEGLLIKDKQKDTLLYTKQCRIRLTDWFFVRNKIDLKFIGIEDAIIHLNRKNEIWNYQYIIDYFGKGTSSKKKSNIQLNLRKIDLKNVKFVQNDAWRGELMQVQWFSLLLEADTINLNSNKFKINALTIDKPVFSIKNFTPNRPDSIANLPVKVNPTKGLKLNTGDLKLTVKDLNIKQGIFKLNNDDNIPLVGFDGEHIQFSNINFHSTDVSMIKDTIRGNILLTTKERSGLEVKRLSAKCRITPTIMEFSKLDLQTNKSRLGDYYAMKYRNFTEDFSHYISNVVMDARFKTAKVHCDDISFFTTALKSWKKEGIITGNFNGTVENFEVKNLTGKIGTSTYINGYFGMKGLPDIDNTVINFNNGLVKTNFNELSVLIPQLKKVTSPNLNKLGDVLYRGDFNGTLNNFSASGSLSTAIGALATQFKMQIPKKGDAVYTGNIVTSNFNIGKLLDNKQIGLLDFAGKVEGHGFNINTLKIGFDGIAQHLDFNGYTYNNITTKGLFQKKYFNGEVKIDDPNVNLISQVEVDLTKGIPKFNILGDLVKSNLQPLHLIEKDYQLTGLIDINFTGNSIDNFIGSAKILNAQITGKNTDISFDSLAVISGFKNNNTKFLNVSSNEFNASLEGDFNIMALPNTFQSFLYKYYPAYILPPSANTQKQAFKFELNTKYFEPYLSLVNPKLIGLNDVSIVGDIDSKKQQLNITGKIPYAKYDNHTLSDLSVVGKGNFDSLTIKGKAAEILINDSLYFPDAQFSVYSANDSSKVHIYTQGNNTLSEANLNVDVFTLEDGIRILLNPSSFTLNEKKWNLEKEGEIVLRKKYLSAQDIRFTQGFQEITVETEEQQDGNINNLDIKLKNVVVGDVTSLFMKNPRLEGTASGNVRLTDFFGDFSADANITADQFRLDDDSIGLVKLKGNYNRKKNKINFNVVSPNKGYNFNADGSYDINDSTGNPLNTTIVLKNSKIDIVTRFVGGIFSEIKGLASGTLNIKGNKNNPLLLGNISLAKAGFRVNYTQVYYTIDSALLKFEEDGIDFGQFILKDTLNNYADVEGKLYESGFKSFYFDFDLNTDKLLLINTKAKDNPQFYGSAIGEAEVSFKGPEVNAKLSIKAKANALSHIYLPNTVNKENAEADFIVFKKYGTDLIKESLPSNFNLGVDLDLSVNNNVYIDVILDELTGDVIKATGNGRLRIKAGTSEPLTIRGLYNIEQGSYDFNFQSFIRKPFIMKSDANNYIEWSGDPMEANIHIDAQYNAENISVSDLVSNQQGSFSNSTKAYRGNVYVIASLRNKLSKPNITFKLDFPPGSQLKNDNTFNEFIARIEKDENELLKQVTYLIVFNSFAPYGEGGNTTTTNFTSIGVNTISQIFVKQINKAVSNVLFKLTRDKSLHFDLGNSVYSSANLFSQGITATGTNSTLDRNRINFKVGYNLFNDNVIVSFGGDFDFNVGGSSSAVQNGEFQWLPDLNVEIVLSNDKKLRALVFSKNSLDVNGTAFGKRNRQGFGLSYKKDFEYSPFERDKIKQLNKKEKITHP